MPHPIKKKRLLRRLFARALQLLAHKELSNQPFTGQLDSIVILAQEKLGDSILLTPLLRNLRHHFPNLEIHLCCFTKASAQFFRNDPHITAIHEVKKNFATYYRNVLSRKFDILFNTKDSPSTHFLLQTLLIRARFKTGLKNPYHEGLFNHLIAIEFNTQMALKNCSLLSLLSINVIGEECRPYIPPAPVSGIMKSFIERMKSGIFTGLNISAGGPLRQWPEKKWSELIAAFPEEQFMVFSAPDESEIKQRIEQTHSNVTSSPLTANIYEAGLLVKMLKLLVTPDTSMVHVASCYNIPVIALYRDAAQDLSRFSPYLIDFEQIISGTSTVADIDVLTVSSALQKKLHEDRLKQK